MLPGREASGFSRAGALAVEGGERLHFVGLELLGGRSHLLIETFWRMPGAAVDVGGMLSLERGSSDFETAGP